MVVLLGAMKRVKTAIFAISSKDTATSTEWCAEVVDQQKTPCSLTKMAGILSTLKPLVVKVSIITLPVFNS